MPGEAPVAERKMGYSWARAAKRGMGGGCEGVGTEAALVCTAGMVRAR